MDWKNSMTSAGLMREEEWAWEHVDDKDVPGPDPDAAGKIMERAKKEKMDQERVEKEGAKQYRGK